ncbi:MAG: AgmX/PglI C-terminal domain-containing protein [Oligoflexia bacterium]|nr:AgmX/PglI C-terminal domain-containing protein [Oligoflexia bacterium]MBF0365104.1 AgmX/PglI C-terminal domain-containing protein [Oligoflexia bacterium]
MKDNAIYLKHPHTSEEQLLDFFDNEAFIGSAPAASIKLSDVQCSDIHAYIAKTTTSDSYYLLDLGSKSGTSIEGKKLKEGTLKIGEEFVIGNSHLLIKKISGESSQKKKMLESFLDQTASNISIASFPLSPTATTAAAAATPALSKESNKKNALKAPTLKRQLLQISLYWGEKQLELRTFAPGNTITIGSKANVIFSVTYPGKHIYKLATYKQEGLTLHIPPKAKGILWKEGKVMLIDELRNPAQESTSVVLHLGDHADLKIGELVLSFQFITPSPKLPRFILPSIEKRLLQILGVMVLLYLLLLLLLLFSPKEEKTAESTPIIKKTKIAKRLQKFLFKPGVEWGKSVQKSAVGEILSSEGGRAKGEEGAVKAAKDTPAPSKEKNKVEKINLAHKTKAEQSKEKDSAKFQELNAEAQKQQEVDKLFAKDFAVDTNSALYKEQGATGKGGRDRSVEEGSNLAAISGGVWARGSSGLGAGGGGVSVGVGTLKGLATGGGMGADDMGTVPTKGHSNVTIATEEEVLLLDGLDPDVIAAIIKRYLPQIQHCYESQLVHHPNIQGKVVVKFSIIHDGSVGKAAIAESTLKDPPTEKCIIEKILKWNFPKPKGGGTVEVKYPFLLMSTKSN